MYHERNTTVLSFYACYWHVVKIFCCGSILKEISVRLLAACLFSCWEKIQGKNACWFVLYHVNYLPFDQCFPSLWTLPVFAKKRKLIKYWKPKPNENMNAPAVWKISAMLSHWPLLQKVKAMHCSFLLHTAAEAVSMKMGPLKCPCPFLQTGLEKGNET